MRYAWARRTKDAERRAYELYMTDAVQMCCKNIADYWGGSYLTKRWSEILNPPPTETKSCEEITADIVKRCGLEVRK